MVAGWREGGRVAQGLHPAFGVDFVYVQWDSTVGCQNWLLVSRRDRVPDLGKVSLVEGAISPL